METENEADMIRIEVAYAGPDKQTLLALAVAFGTTVAEAIEQSANLLIHPRDGIGQVQEQ